MDERNRRINLVIVTNMLAPYRIPLFEKINTHPQIDLHVIVRETISKERSAWQIKHGDFSISQLKNLQIKLASLSFDFPLGLVGKLKELHPDVLVVGGFSFDAIIASMYSHIHTIPIYIWSGETPLSYSINNYSAARGLIRKQIIRCATGFLAYGPDAKNYLLSLQVPEEKIQIVNNICDATPFIIAGEEKKEKINKNEDVMLYVGSLKEQKNILKLIRGFHAVSPEYSSLKLKIVGGGPLRSALDDYIRKFNLKNVEIIGETPSNKIPGVMLEADFLILPSIYDQWPHVVMEAMAAGLPVLCSNTAGIPPYIVKNGENGFFFSPESEDSIIGAIRQMMAKRSEWKEMGRKSTSIVKEYSIDRSAELFLEPILKYSYSAFG